MKFSPKEPPSVGRLISILHRMTSMYLQRELEPLGLGHGQVRLLHYLDKRPGVRQQELSDHFRLDKGSTSALISGLEKNGYVRREKDPDDQRAQRLFPTQKALDIRPELKKVFNNWSQILKEDMTKKEEEVLIYQLTKMIGNADPDFNLNHHHGQK